MVAILLGLGVLAATFPASAGIIVIVVDRDTKAGVHAEVYRVSPPHPDVDLGQTSDDGQVSNDVANCALGDAFRVQPLDSDYPPPTMPVACSPPKTTIRLRAWAEVTQIQNVAAHAEAGGHFARAAQAYTELNAIKPDEQTAQKVFTNTALALGLTKDQAVVVDPRQGKAVPSPVLVGRIRTFQAQNGIDTTGRIDGRTLDKMAAGSIAKNVLFTGS
jgi:hypothetical protein